MRFDLALLFMITLQMLIFVFNSAASGIATSEGVPYSGQFGGNTDFINSYGAANNTLETDGTGALPTSTAGVTPETSVFIIPLTVFTNWANSVPGLNYFVAFTTSIPNFIAALGFPLAISFALSFFWYSIGVFLFIMWIKGN